MSKRARPRAHIPGGAICLNLPCRTHARANTFAFSDPQDAAQASPPVNTLSLDEALRLANAQASTYQSAVLNERIAAEDVKQAQSCVPAEGRRAFELHLHDAGPRTTARRTARTQFYRE